MANIFYNDFLKVKISSMMLLHATSRSNKMGTINNSHTLGKGNMAGFLGEEIVLDQISYAKLVDNYDYDISLGIFAFDIKSKQVNTIPEHTMDVTVYNGSLKQKNWGYIFTRILYNETETTYPHGWILGWIKKTDFISNSIKHKKGEVDKTNNYTYIGDCYNLSITKLEPIEELIENSTHLIKYDYKI